MNRNSPAQMRHITLRLTASAATSGRLTTTRASADQIRHVPTSHRIPAVATIRALRAPLPTIVILLYQVVPSSKRDQMRVVRRRRYRHTSRASNIRVAELVGQRLQLVGREMIIVPQNVVVRRPARALDARVTAQIKIEFSRVRDAGVDRRAWRYVAAPPALFFAIGAE